ncbi:hypothetical protein Gotur_016618, partial [Gossypium turneri]
GEDKTEEGEAGKVRRDKRQGGFSS